MSRLHENCLLPTLLSIRNAKTGPARASLADCSGPKIAQHSPACSTIFFPITPATISSMVASLSFNQTMVEGIADQFGSGRELKFVHEPGAIGADGLDAEREGLGDVLDRTALS